MEGGRSGMTSGPTWRECQGSGEQAARSKGLAGSSQDDLGLGCLMGLERVSSEQEGAEAWLVCALPTSRLESRAAVSLEDC